MQFKSAFLSSVCLLLFMACSIEPEPIHFGEDACHFCKMAIVDNQHAAEFVTKKGKVYKFDAAECMLNQLKTFDEATIKMFLVSDYASPGKLTDAKTATYLISKTIPSPMGAFLSAFELELDAVKTQKTSGGEIYTWAQLNTKYGLKP